MSAETRRPFDLTAGPLVRFLWLRRGMDDHVLAMIIHHLITDMWSLALLCGEVLARCAGSAAERGPRGRGPAANLADFVAAEDEFVGSPAGAKLLAFWSNTLRNAPLSVLLPNDRLPGPGRSGVGGIVPLEIDAGLARHGVASALAGALDR